LASLLFQNSSAIPRTLPRKQPG